jgi:hypothetical protein
MHIDNVHERIIDASADAVGEVLDSLTSSDDRLWPRHAWPAMRLDAPLGVGARGGHAFVRYHVVEYEPGRRVEFEFDPRLGVVGRHAFVVEPLDAAHCALRHELHAEANGVALVNWLFVVRALHDACVEDALDCAEHAVTGGVPRPTRWTVGVRALRRWVRSRAREEARAA